MNFHEDIKYQILDAQRHFEDHVAQYLAIADRRIGILDWRKPNSIHYAMRVVFDSERGSRVYISGDLGEAVAYPTCHATLDGFVNCFTYRDKNGHMDVRAEYFLEKVRATSDRYYWSREAFVEDFMSRVQLYTVDGDWRGLDVEEFLKEHLGYENGTFDPFGGEGIEIDDGVRVSEDVKRELERADHDYWEWLYSCGKRIHPRIILWLVGTRLAWEQLNNMKVYDRGVR